MNKKEPPPYVNARPNTLLFYPWLPKQDKRIIKHTTGFHNKPSLHWGSPETERLRKHLFFFSFGPSLL